MVAGGGGAGGLIYDANYSISANTSYSVTVGAGGAGEQYFVGANGTKVQILYSMTKLQLVVVEVVAIGNEVVQQVVRVDQVVVEE